ncbi:transglycosylase SLT domain-containing protein [Thalassococcus lentus]|uniref:Transglycosylase SLT domain-containing protein n=1 Tax=Thalassococcus lentus TaxID=1210524 RepID=A0ABT4XX50_9RHOB|nr:transglycosylase SLT domain-containing protein [Thalassococcus lentus]MDA7426546.1 transglycosylase SLT domain-containing protein [Thalassococcus lentus]
MATGGLFGQAAMANPAPAPAQDRAKPLVNVDLSPTARAVAASLRPQARRTSIPVARWDKHGGEPSWTLAVLSGLRGHASVLPTIVPKDIAQWCPAYPNADQEGREAFWVGLISTLAKHESTYRPTAVGGGGLWYGLVQIYPDTARRYKCKAKTGAALKDPEDNLSCALRIMAVTVPRDRVVSQGMRGVAADWGPFHSRRKRMDMMDWTRKQSYCAGLTRSLRPMARPSTLNIPDLLAPVYEAEDLVPAQTDQG